jgi:hypothetical protein
LGSRARELLVGAAHLAMADAARRVANTMDAARAINSEMSPQGTRPMALLYRSLPVCCDSQRPRQPYGVRRTPARTLAVRAVAREQGEHWALERGCGLLATATAMTIALPLIFQVAVPPPAQAIQPVSGVRSPELRQHRAVRTRTAKPGWLSYARRSVFCSTVASIRVQGQLGLKPFPGVPKVPTTPSHFYSVSTTTNSFSHDSASSDRSGD